MTTPERQAIHAQRLAVIDAAATERDWLIALLVEGGQMHGAAAEAADRLIVAMRRADAVRLQLASFEHNSRLKYAQDAVDWLTEHCSDAPVAAIPAEPAEEQQTPQEPDEEPEPGMLYASTVTRPDGGVDDAPEQYADRIVTNTLRAALNQGYTLDADASASEITLSMPGRNTISVRPARPLPKPTAAQRREILALAASTGPVVWGYGSSNVIQMRDGDRVIKHAMTMSLINGGYLAEVTGNGNPANLSLLAYLTIGKTLGDDLALTAALRNIYSTR